MADLGKVFGVDYSEVSVAASPALNRAAVASGQIVMQRAAVVRSSALSKRTTIGPTFPETRERFTAFSSREGW